MLLGEHVLANMLHNKSMLLKLENIIVFTIYYSSYLRYDPSLTHHACVLAGCISGWHQSIILSVGGAERIILSAGGAKSMMFSACAESIMVSAPPAESMILSAPFDHIITLTAAGAMGGYKKINNHRY